MRRMACDGDEFRTSCTREGLEADEDEVIPASPAPLRNLADAAREDESGPHSRTIGSLQLTADSTTCCSATDCKTCSADPAKCDSCHADMELHDVAGTCTACSVGFYLDDDSETCTACTAINCQTCNVLDPAKCEVCSEGSQFNKGAGTCTSCMATNCESCNAHLAKCDSCLEGFHANVGASACCAKRIATLAADPT